MKHNPSLVARISSLVDAYMRKRAGWQRQAKLGDGHLSPRPSALRIPPMHEEGDEAMRDESQKIACLGWGSLIWDPRGLPLRRTWFNDGPLLPIEFARHSKDGRITLVIVPETYGKVAYMRTLWALMAVDRLDNAKRVLAEREGTGQCNIGWWSQSGAAGKDFAGTVGTWAVKKDLDGVVWTVLKPNFSNKVPKVNEVLKHLRNLSSDYYAWKRAEEYVRKAPEQIDTEYRRRIEYELGWTAIPTNYAGCLGDVC